jgi:RNA polymerase sigma-70 factor (ECF subfamily)
MAIMSDLRQASTLLVRQHLAGDARAFEALVRLWDQRLFLLAHRLCGDRHDAEDIRQEAWIRCHVGLESLRTPDTFAAWLARIAVNLCRDRARRRGGEAPVEAEPPAATMDPALECETAEAHLALRRALAALPALEREVLLLRVLQELSFDEIARVVEKPRSTVQWLCGRALETVSRRLAHNPLWSRSADAMF